MKINIFELLYQIFTITVANLFDWLKNNYLDYFNK